MCRSKNVACVPLCSNFSSNSPGYVHLKDFEVHYRVTPIGEGTAEITSLKENLANHPDKKPFAHHLVSPPSDFWFLPIDLPDSFGAQMSIHIFL